MVLAPMSIRVAVRDIIRWQGFKLYPYGRLTWVYKETQKLCSAMTNLDLIIEQSNATPKLHQ